MNVSRRRAWWWLKRVAVCLLLGVVTTVGVAWGLAWRWFGPHAQKSETQYTASDHRGERITVAQPGLRQQTVIQVPRRKFITETPLFVSCFGRDIEMYPGVEVDPAVRLPHDGEAWGVGRSLSQLPGRAQSSCRVDEAASGWPRLCLWWGDLTVRQPDETYSDYVVTKASTQRITLSNANVAWFATTPRALPVCPIWGGFVVNAMVYGAAWSGMVLVPPLVRRAVRRRRGLCAECGYDLSWLGAGVCPECGLGREGASDDC